MLNPYHCKCFARSLKLYLIFLFCFFFVVYKHIFYAISQKNKLFFANIKNAKVLKKQTNKDKKQKKEKV